MTIATTYRQTRSFTAQQTQQDDIPTNSTPTYRSYAMQNVPVTSSNTSGWISFVYAQFAIALGMAGFSIVFLPHIDLQTKMFLAMSVIFSVGATFTLAKTVRDEHENKKLSSRIDDARAEKLLMEVGRG
jgi:hypothetical protein